MLENYYNEIKDLVIDTETTIKVKDYTKNRVMLENYYEIGRLIVEAQGGEEKAKYGNKIIKEYANKLTIDLGKGYSWRNLYNMRSYYMLFSKNEILQTLSAKLSWSHYIELLSLKDIYEIKYYIETTSNSSVRQFKERIKSKEYDRLPESTKERLKENKEIELKELVTDPIIIPNPNNIEIIKEKELQKLILDNLDSFLKKLGIDYHYVGCEYPIKIGNIYHRIDLLLYNMEYEAYVVIELKIGELKKEHIGQIETYMNYINKMKKKPNQNKTIGIILCHRNNKLLMEYCSNPDILVREYLLN